jgi:hypothetical protein
MSWKCPACQTLIQHERDVSLPPVPGVIYRCHVCRLELVFNPVTKKLALAPMPEEA